MLSHLSSVNSSANAAFPARSGCELMSSSFFSSSAVSTTSFIAACSDAMEVIDRGFKLVNTADATQGEFSYTPPTAATKDSSLNPLSDDRDKGGEGLELMVREREGGD